MKKGFMKPSLTIFIAISAILIVFILPFGIHLDLGPGPNSLVSMIWETPLEPAWYTIRYLSAFQFYFEFILFRLIFFAEICLLLVGKFNKISFILVGVISELIPLLISIPALFILNADGDNLITIIFPIPFLLIFDLILVQLANKLKFNNINDKI
ncbi:MAG: hypothetical protein JSV62_03955 [Promethearchaeota archaeon]|nr:MAG: hypothetical protein JSV62_03955 [Candidatus Lokiarchaeota archaeon]